MVDPNVPVPGMIEISLPLILIQLCNFLVALAFLNYVLIKPVRDIIAERKAKMAGLLDSADDFNKAADLKLKNYESELAKARVQAVSQRDDVRDSALKVEADILGQANSDAQTFIQDAKAQIKSEAKKAMLTLKDQIDALSVKAVDRILS
ncbi:ATP synthase F0 subunit B [Desulfovibrio litoralis]|uniref:ATP synthase subunit b n=1 Tax=Desulfovibrio litoralis DSM 11393 TaxID=1121455 RepID=A0A1M7S7L8_9BACT|nr:ATP synthase F0 subunit B [Desulfovibrio litoralis]SHN54649.1 F-type H+-transporting ATPase subunit b [Desulfovibrio litoralis DSM 11393]